MKGGIEIRNVSKRYGSLEVVKNLSLDIAAGEFVCLLGESGCGKSTLIRIMAGIESFQSGSITVDDHATETQRAALVMQHPTLLPWLSVTDNIGLPFKVEGEQPDPLTLKEKIEMVGLTGFENAKPKELSGGMAQRVALARALVHDRSVLLLDEPFSALDPVTRLKMRNDLLRIYRERNLTVVIATHDIEEAVALGTKIVLLGGRPATIQRVLENQQHASSASAYEMKGVISDLLMSNQQEERGVVQ